MSEYNYKNRILYGEAWKNLPEATKQDLRKSWKELDSACKKQGGKPVLIDSFVEDGRSIKGCNFVEDYSVADAKKNFITMVKNIEIQMKERLTEYAVESYHLRGEFLYETDGDWHHMRLIDKEDYEDDTTEIILETHRRGGSSKDELLGLLPSYVENYVTRMQRIDETKKEYEIKQILHLADKIEKLRFKTHAEEARLEYDVEACTLAGKVKKLFEEA